MNRWQLRATLNVLNLSTPLGLLVSLAGRARLRRGPRGLVLASDFCLTRLPPAFTVGNVVISPRPAAYLDERPRLLAHEERHTWQYLACLGLPFLPLYAVASGWSWVRGGDPAVHNVFERLAGLADGGYPLLSARERRRRRPQPAAAAAP